MRDDCDGFLGAVFAAEGTEGFRALINGPGGCRSRTQILVQEQFPEWYGEARGCMNSPFMSRQSRVPCTFLNNDDIVFGSGEKIAEGIASVAEATGGGVVLIETLAASVQVADRVSAARKSGYGDRVVLADPDVSSLSFCQGFDDTMEKIVDLVHPDNGDTDGRRVNILGYGAFDSDWHYGKDAIREMLSMMDIEVVSFVGLDSSEKLAESGSADFNVMIHPECARKTAEWYSENLGIPFVEPSMGAPIGYPSIRRFLKEVSDVTDMEDDAPRRVLDEDEERMFRILRNFDKFSAGLRCEGMGFEGMPSDVLPVMEWMYDLFSLVPEYVDLRRTSDPRDSEGVEGFLRSIGSSDALGAGFHPDLKVMFTDALSAELYAYRNPKMSCVGFEMPFSGIRGIADRSMMWVNGCHTVLDAVMNGLGKFRCGLPTAAEYR